MSEKRQELVETALQLFAQHGFHATGIDRIAEQAQVSKKTMYNHFRSKEELIVAALRYHDGLFRNHFMKAVEQAASSPHERLLAIYDVAHQWFSERKFYGCIFINAIGEYSNRNSAIQEACKEFKRLMRLYISELTQAIDADDSDALAEELAILLEGSIVTAQVSGTPDCAKRARHAAQVLIDNAVAKPRPQKSSLGTE